jgi:hypothetical protein
LKIRLSRNEKETEMRNLLRPVGQSQPQPSGSFNTGGFGFLRGLFNTIADIVRAAAGSDVQAKGSASASETRKVPMPDVVFVHDNPVEFGGGVRFSATYHGGIEYQAQQNGNFEVISGSPQAAAQTGADSE